MSTSRISISAIADSVGYQNIDVFRRAFERRFGVAPSAYRARFPAITKRAQRSIA